MDEVGAGNELSLADDQAPPSLSPVPDLTTPPPAAASDRVYVMRAALAQIRLPEGQEPIFTLPAARSLATVVDASFRDALAKDARVTEVIDADADFEIDNARTYTRNRFNPDEEHLLDAVESYQVLRLNDLIWFRVRVPAKNQPRYRCMNDVPADEYLVVWDGISLGVQWLQQEPRVTGSGGHVVFDILEEVGRRAGYPVEIVACSPGCHHRFVHGDFISFDSADLPKQYKVSGPTQVGCTIVSPHRFLEDDQANLLRNFAEIHAALDDFAEAQAVADSIAFMESRARSDSTEVLQLSYLRAARTKLPNALGALRDLWRLRSSSRRIRQLIAGLWLALASVDADLAHWRARLASLEALIDARGLGELRDVLDPGRKVVEGIDLTMVRAALQEMATRLEGRALLWATTAGACAALAGAALAALLT